MQLFNIVLVDLLFCRWVFIHEKAYQTKDTGIESSVMTKVKGFGYHHDQVLDVADYVFPSQVCDYDNTWRSVSRSRGGWQSLYETNFKLYKGLRRRTQSRLCTFNDEAVCGGFFTLYIYLAQLTFSLPFV